MTGGQRLALEQLDLVEAASEDHALEIVRIHPPSNLGWLHADISISCADLELTEAGLPLRARERFSLMIPPGFPFEVPVVRTPHVRFGGWPHVQWKRELCLYLSRETEWLPKDGLFGLLERLHDWLRHGAKGQWEEEGAPLHPPVAYSKTDSHLIIPRADVPNTEGQGWLGLAELNPVSTVRTDIVGWSSIQDPLPSFAAPTVLLSTEFPFEYPDTVGRLLSELQDAGISRHDVVLLLKVAVIINGTEKPIHIVIGTPMRGIQAGERRQHLAVWRLPSDLAEIINKTVGRMGDTDELTTLRETTALSLIDALAECSTEWCRVHEARPEVVNRRDQGSAVSWFRDKKVSLWGCGALGGYIALALARSGVQEIVLRDNSVVTPGLLERQPYNDNHLNHPKVLALQEQIESISPTILVRAKAANLLRSPLNETDWTDEADIVIDASANRHVLSKLETVRWQSNGLTVPIISMMIDNRAERGIVTVSGSDYTGAGADILRKTKVWLSRHHPNGDFLNAFWPRERSEFFFPEPGCSSPTFVGSAADSMALSASMLNVAALELEKGDSSCGSGHLLTAPHRSEWDSRKEVRGTVRWQSSLLVSDDVSGYQIRISRSAWRSIKGWIRRAARNGDPRAETGGLLFGERDDAAKLVWVDDAVGPPPDSLSSRDGFLCGTQGARQMNNRKREGSAGSVAFVGMWHTHPDSDPIPSIQDFSGMRQILDSTRPSPLKALLLIIACHTTLDTEDRIAGFVFERSLFEPPIEIDSEWSEPRDTSFPDPESTADRPIGLALSGGGSRAMAFHLGCLRALHDLGLLPLVRVVSAVSGGAVIAGMFAYRVGDFEDFEAATKKILTQGIQRKILREVIQPTRIIQSLGTVLGPGLISLGATAARTSLGWWTRATGERDPGAYHWTDRIQAPLPRWSSRTLAFEAALNRHVFKGKTLASPRWNNIDIVLNATDLRTLSAFRFGSRESGNWRFGRLSENELSVAHAVAASAAYPPLLPAIDRKYQFDKNGHSCKERLILADGGVYDNLGVTCLEPSRDPTISYNVFHVPYIVSCDAGAGLPTGHHVPFWWPARMTRSFETALRQTQHDTQRRLHRYSEHGQLDGFIYAYLGQRDDRLPYRPADLVPREEVMAYPTGFTPVSQAHVERLSARGEQLIHVLMDHYAPSL